ncbi:peroxiredoxin [Wenxinia saemankumensis]|uniref:Glutathione-dependent peroxiredoxin n=1 Tax=Wenxinia saemankumensis TaxID=1447782 RepID=A0A1M6EUT4_9RHOB|nr:peroxiredoxin [Wenxinia saemankumensis]SHI89227.1 Peroxiredoxin [Wenxinia saemankumensis]
MGVSRGDRMPDATVLVSNAEGRPEEVRMHDLAGTGRVVVFGLPGAFTGTCSTAHVPSFVRTKDAFAEAGIDRIVCVSVNDSFVMEAWGRETGAAGAGIVMAGDASGEFTRAMGMEFTAEAAGLFGRSKRYSMLVEDGVVTILNPEESPGLCETSAGETLLEQVRSRRE